jgi:hypothetical protein
MCMRVCIKACWEGSKQRSNLTYITTELWTAQIQLLQLIDLLLHSHKIKLDITFQQCLLLPSYYSAQMLVSKSNFVNSVDLGLWNKKQKKKWLFLFFAFCSKALGLQNLQSLIFILAFKPRQNEISEIGCNENKEKTIISSTIWKLTLREMR